MANVKVTVEIDEDAACAIAALLRNMRNQDYDRLATSDLHAHALKDLYLALGDRFEWSVSGSRSRAPSAIGTVHCCYFTRYGYLCLNCSEYKFAFESSMHKRTGFPA